MSPETHARGASTPPRSDDAALDAARAHAPAMFDRIARTYDALNGVLSLGMHHGWRRRALSHVLDRSELRALDVATGTGDVLLALLDDPRVVRVDGVDLSVAMLAEGRKKLARHARADAAQFTVGDALALPFEDARFDVATMAFGIRNVVDVDRALRELRRVLVPGGRAIVLEFSTPEPGPFATLYDVYRREVLPRIGRALSGDDTAYRYLDETIARFPSGSAMVARFVEAGFSRARHVPLAMGAVTIYLGDR